MNDGELMKNNYKLYKLLKKALSQDVEHDDSYIAVFEVKRILLLAIAETRKEERKNCIKKLKETNPYPDDVFLPATKAQKKRLIEAIKNYNLSPDGIFGSFGRAVWQNAILKLEEIEEDEN